MPRREYRTTFTCAEPGCRETQFFTSTTRADEAALWKQQKAVPFRCTRHRNPEQNLRPGNERTTRVLVATKRPHGMSWVPEGETTGSGFKYGPGFTAHAEDFPEGTRLVVTAQIELPGETAATAAEEEHQP